MKYLDRVEKLISEHVKHCRQNIPWDAESRSVAREIMLIFSNPINFEKTFWDFDQLIKRMSSIFLRWVKKPLIWGKSCSKIFQDKENFFIIQRTTMKTLLYTQLG